MSRLRPCLWFDGRAEEAARFYTRLLPDSRIDHVMRGPGDWPAGRAGEVLVVEFTLAGQPYMALNGGPHFSFTPAVSLSVRCADQAEVDRLWDTLTADGGAPGQCGWLTDRYGLSWQIVPVAMEAMMRDTDTVRAGRAMRAMMGMGKLDVAALQRAYEQ